METPIVLPITKNMSAIDEAGLQGRFARASPTKAPPKPLKRNPSGRHTVVTAFAVAAFHVAEFRPCGVVKNPA